MANPAADYNIQKKGRKSPPQASFFFPKIRHISTLLV